MKIIAHTKSTTKRSLADATGTQASRLQSRGATSDDAGSTAAAPDARFASVAGGTPAFQSVGDFAKLVRSKQKLI